MEINQSKYVNSLFTNCTNENVCRTCMSVKDLHPLFPQKAKYQDFVRALLLCTGLHIHMDDGLPQHICRRCAKIIQSAMKFRIESQSVDKKLRLLYINHKDSKNKLISSFKSTCISDQNNTKIEIEFKKIESEDDKFDSGDNESDISCDPREEPLQNSEIEKFSAKNKKRKITRKTVSPSMFTKISEGELKPSERALCKICNKSYKTVSNLKAHIKHTHENCKLLCEFCGLRFPNNIQRLRHLRARHDLARDDSFACSHCGFQALDKEQLESHERRLHTKERPYMCVECGEAFYTKRVLVQHSYKHKTETPFHCEFCPKKFKFRAKLNQHKNTVHFKKQRPFVFGCYICSKKFQTPNNVRKHLLRMHQVPRDQQGKLLKFSREQAKEEISLQGG